MLYYTCVISPLGRLFLVEKEGGLAFCAFDALPAKAAEAQQKRTPLLDKAAGLLESYFAGVEADLSVLPLCPSGTPFQKKVWQIIRQTAPGQTITYGQLAQKIAPPGKAAERWNRAAAAACGKNPVAIFIPCHRVVGAGGWIGGYNGGVERKNQLLLLEGSLK